VRAKQHRGVCRSTIQREFGSSDFRRAARRPFPFGDAWRCAKLASSVCRLLAANAVRWWVIRSIRRDWNVRSWFHAPRRGDLRTFSQFRHPLWRPFLRDAGASTATHRLRSPLSQEPCANGVRSTPLTEETRALRHPDYRAAMTGKAADSCQDSSETAARMCWRIYAWPLLLFSAANLRPRRMTDARIRVSTIVPETASDVIFFTPQLRRAKAAKKFREWESQNPDANFGQVAVAASYLFGSLYRQASSQ